jgi:outer membrane protein assembly factor BamB
MNTNFPEQPSIPGQLNLSAQQTKRRRNMRLFGGLCALAFLLVSALVTALVLGSTHRAVQASGGAPTPTPTVGTPAPGQPRPNGSLYTATPGSLARVDLKTGQTVWTIQASDPSAPVVMGNTLFFENQDSANPFIEAASVKTGQQLWRTQQSPYGLLLSSNNELFDNFCNLSSTGTTCSLDRINTSTGAVLWSSTNSQGSSWITAQNGVLYVVSYTSYFALKASTGAVLWQKNLLNYPNQEATMAPVVSGNVLSFASCNETKQTSDYQSCYLYAFNASTGNELWHLIVPPGALQVGALQATPAIMHGVVYAGSIDGTLYAVNEQSGQQLWSASAGGTIGQVFASAGTVYVEVISPDGTSSIEAFNAATHALIWGPLSDVSQPQGATTLLADREALSGGPASHPFVFEHGLIYLQSGPTTITVLKATNGSQVAQYTVSSGTLDGFTVVA